MKTKNLRNIKSTGVASTALIALLVLTGCQLDQSASTKSSSTPVLVAPTEVPVVEVPAIAEEPAPPAEVPEAPAPPAEVPAYEPPAPDDFSNCVDNSQAVATDGGMSISMDINCSLGN